MQDITKDYNQTATSRQKREQFFQTIHEAIEEAIFVVDVLGSGEYRYSYINKVAEKLTEYSIDEVIGKTPEDILPNQAAASVRQRYNQCVEANEKITYEECLPFKNSELWWLTTLSPLFNEQGRLYCLVGTSLNITARKQTEKALAESERKFRAIFNQTFQFTGLMRLDGTLIEANQTALDFIGKTAADVINRPFWEAPWWRNSDKPRLQEAIATAAMGEFVRYEVECTGADNQTAIFDFSIKPIFDENGKVILLIPEGRNITERKQAEAEILRLNQELEQRVARRTAELETVNQRLTLALEAANLGSWDWDISTNKVVWSSLHAEIFGYQPENLENRTYSDWEVRVHPLDLPKVLAATQKALNNGEEYNYQYRIIWPDGSIHWIYGIGRGYYDDSGRPIRMLGMVLDITKQKQAELDLEASEQRLQLVIEAINEAIWDWDIVADTCFWSRQYYRLFGLTPSVLQLKAYESFYQRVHPEDVKAFEQILKEHFENNRPYEIELRMQRYDGSYRWFFTRGKAIRDSNGRPIRMVGSLSDITERKQAQEALALSEERFRATFEQAAVGIAHLDLNGRWTIVNQKLCDILGYSREELLEKSFADITYPEDLKADYHCIERLMAGEIEHCSLEKRYIKKDGSLVWIDLTVSLKWNKKDNKTIPEYYIAVIEEINDRKKAEFELQKRAEELEWLTSLLQKRNQELDRFSYIVSHDLKAPLRAIANLSQWIEEDLKEILPEENQRQMQLLRSRVERMDALINALLDYSRATKIEGKKETVELSNLLAEIIDSLDPPKQFIIEIQSPMPTLFTKKVALSQVFANLIGNAIKHHHRADGKIKIFSCDRGSFYEFAVADDGPGIPQSAYERVFTLFETISNQGNREGSTGVGLAIVKKIVENEGGTVRLESEIGKGTTFYFTWAIE